MDYNQPYGGAAGAPYVNGNPATGVAGSIPPAAAIEYPQREIVGIVADCGLTPDNANLHQLALAVQGGQLNYADDTGTAGNLVVTLPRAPAAYVKGMRFSTKLAYAIPGATVCNLNALGNRPVINFDGSALAQNQYQAGAIVTLEYDGTNLQIAGNPGAFAQSGTVKILSAPTTYYVNSSTGSDSNDGLTSGTAFATLQKAANTILTFNQNGFLVTISVENGTNAPVIFNPLNGAGGCLVVGNKVTPASCTIASTAGAAIRVLGDGYNIQGFKLTSSADGTQGNIGTGISVIGTGVRCGLGFMEYGACVSGHVYCNAAHITFSSPQAYPGIFNRISGATNAHLTAVNGGQIEIAGPDLIITSAFAFSYAFAAAATQGIIYGQFGTITNPGCTGSRYIATLNAIINTSGGGASYFPGSTAGNTASGGQYA